jgi:hypothetical protein
MKRAVAATVSFLVINLSVVEACTHGTFLLPMKPGMVPVERAMPLAIRHQNGKGNYTVRVYRKGHENPWEDGHVFAHDAYIVQRASRAPEFFLKLLGESVEGIICGINAEGAGEATQNWGGTGEKDDKLVRLRAVTTAGDFDEMARLIKPESYANSTYVIGRKEGVWTVGYQVQGQMTIHTPENPWRVKGNSSDAADRLLQDTRNWTRGDPNLLEVRDLVYIWHRINASSDFMALYLPHLRLVWTTVGPARKGPMIPFSLDEFFVHPEIAGKEYNLSLKSDPYSQAEIDAIEDQLMGADGRYIGGYSIKELQNRIVNRLPIHPVPEESQEAESLGQ